MRTLIGFVIIVIGLGLFLEKLNVPGASAVLSAWWPFVIIAVGLMMWNGNRRHWFAPAFVVLFGVVLALEHFSVITQSVWELFWPGIILLVGVRVALGKPWGDRMKQETGPVSAAVYFSGLDRQVNGEVHQGEISAWFGGVKMDLRNAQFPEAVTLNVTAGFGGIEFLVPTSVRVVSHVTGIFGGSDDKTSAATGATKTLTLTGMAFFGGVSVKN